MHISPSSATGAGYLNGSQTRSHRPSLPSCKIRPARLEDLPQCAVCYGDRHDTYPSIFPLRLRRKDVTVETRLQANRDALRRELEDTEYKEFSVAVAEDDDSRVLGYSIWSKPGYLRRDLDRSSTEKSIADATSSSKTEAERLVEQECDLELAGMLGKESIEVKPRLCGEDHWFFSQLFVHPDHQRRGVGTALLEHGLARIQQQHDDSDRAIALTSSPQARALYERYGFQEVYRFRPDVVDLNEHGELVPKAISWPLMIRGKPASSE